MHAPPVIRTSGEVPAHRTPASPCEALPFDICAPSSLSSQAFLQRAAVAPAVNGIQILRVRTYVANCCGFNVLNFSAEI
jgi:hypothetical protein